MPTTHAPANGTWRTSPTTPATSITPTTAIATAVLEATGSRRPRAGTTARGPRAGEPADRPRRAGLRRRCGDLVPRQGYRHLRAELERRPRPAPVPASSGVDDDRRLRRLGNGRRGGRPGGAGVTPSRPPCPFVPFPFARRSRIDEVLPPAERVPPAAARAHLERAALHEAEQHVEQRVPQAFVGGEDLARARHAVVEDAEARAHGFHRGVGIGPHREQIGRERRCEHVFTVHSPLRWPFSTVPASSTSTSTARISRVP